MKTFVPDHTCSTVFRNKQANRKWVIEKLVRKLRKQPTLEHGEAAKYIKRKCRVQLNRTLVVIIERG